MTVSRILRPLIPANYRSIAASEVAKALPGFISDPEDGTPVRTEDILPEIAAGPNRSVYIVWQEATLAPSGSAIALSKSHNGGLTWTTPVRINTVPTTQAFTASIEVGPDGTLGVTVAVFQHGWLAGVVGVDKGPIDTWVPVILFAIVFGLSMDYEVFLVSRIHEEWLRRRDPSRAVVVGVATTGRVITAAATIMVCVFLSFVLLPERPVKVFGLALATAVFLDAVVIRSLLLPALLELLGRWTWILPGWLDRMLPRGATESSARPAPDRTKAA